MNRLEALKKLYRYGDAQPIADKAGVSKSMVYKFFRAGAKSQKVENAAVDYFAEKERISREKAEKLKELLKGA